MDRSIKSDHGPLMRILITTHQFLPDFSTGTEILALSLARELIGRGHAVQIFTGFPGQPVEQPDEKRFDRYEYEGITVHRFTHAYVPMGGITNVSRLEYDNPLAASFFAKVIEEFKPDLVHAYHLARLSTSILNICKTAHIPVVFTATDFWFICPLSQLLLPGDKLCEGPSCNAGNCIKHLAVAERPTPFRRALYQIPDSLIGFTAGLIQRGWFPPTPYNPLIRATMSRAEFIRDRLNQVEQIIAPSQTMRAMMLKHGIDPERILYLPYSVDTRHIQRITGKARRPSLRVGFIGTLAPHKAPHLLIEAVRQLANQPIEVSLHGVGPPNSPYPDHLRRLAADDSRIHFQGGFAHSRISEILAEIDILVVPSIWYENTPLVIYEAQAAGCAVVTSDRSGLAEAIVDETNGLLFRAGDASDLAQKLARLCQNRDFAGNLAASVHPHIPFESHIDTLESIYRRNIHGLLRD
jgi:glycosyltransferase involved in cell wall biosynthesis